ncbi:MAG: oxidoreductase [Clostridiales Family XIII bacterium]|jgi:nitrogenase molybdenum-iron protein alpha chain|nr:oxidoreductase [Clostridiales Family XIII bacterium]
MALNLSTPEVESREQRLGSITGYFGTQKDMAAKGCAGCLGNRKRCFTTSSSCAHTHALSLLGPIEGALVVDHAPTGCGAGIINFSIGRIYAKEKGLGHYKIVSTDLREQDTVFGATDKLRATIRAAYERHKPEIIFVTTSCVSSIIGDDVWSVVQEMREELPVPVGFAAVEGIKSKIWASGFDAYCHAVSDAILTEPRKKTDSVNYIAFNEFGRELLDPLIERLGYKVVYLTGNSTMEDYRAASQSALSFGQCGAQSSYLAGALEQKFGVKYFQSHLPFGGIGFERFYRDIAKFLGKEDVAETVIAEERAKYGPELARLREVLAGKTALIALGASYAYEYSRILRELGITPKHAVAYHYDPRLDNQSDDLVAAAADALELDDDIDTTVNDAQELETYLLVKREKPDLILSRAHGASAWGALCGVPAVEGRISLHIFGYPGLVALGRVIEEELANRNFVRKLGAVFRSPFTEEFERRDPHSFFEDEGDGAIG